MKLNDKVALWVKKKSSEPDISSDSKKKISKSLKDIFEAVSTENLDERINPSLGENYTKPGIFKLTRLVLSMLLLVLTLVWEFSGTTDLGIRLAAALIAGYDIIIAAFSDIRKRIYLRENLLVVVATVISFCIGREVEAVIAPILLQTAYIVRDYVLYRTRNAILDVFNPENDLSKNVGAEKNISVEDTMMIDAGMSIPTDCIIIEGSGTVDFGFITGERSPKNMSKGGFLPAGCKCIDGQFSAEVCAVPESSLYKQISSVLKSGYGIITETERAWIAATKLFVPVFLTISIILLVLLPLAFNFSLIEAFRRIVTIVAIASPSGVLLAIPLSYFAGIAVARKNGIVFRDARAFEKSALIKAVVFNKLGTLTEKNYTVTDIKTDKMDPATFLKVAAYAEANSDSNVAKAIVAAYGEEISKDLVQNFNEFPGKGVSVSVDDIQIILGSRELFTENEISVPSTMYEGSIVYMAVNGIYAGRIALSEKVTKDALETVHRLPSCGIDRIAMVSGDGRERDRLVANELAIEEYYAECKPEEKAQRIKGLKERLDPRSTLAFVGNSEGPKQGFDAADIGIKINGIACCSQLPQADIVIMENSTSPIPALIRIARSTKRIIFWGAFICCLVKVVIVALASFGFAPLWFGMLIDSCVSIAFIISCISITTHNEKNEQIS